MGALLTEWARVQQRPRAAGSSGAWAVSSTSSSGTLPHRPPLPSRGQDWPRKASLYVLRTDGKSCSRELVTGIGRLTFAYPSTQQHLLVWRHRPRTVMVLKKLGDELMDEFVEVVRYLALEHSLHVVVEPWMLAEHSWIMDDPELGGHLYTWKEEDSDRLAEHIDFIVCLGGDGVILHAGYLFQSNIPPVIAFNLGSLGFLTNHLHEDFKLDLESVIYGAASLATCSLSEEDSGDNSMGVMVTLRMRLKCEIMRNGCDMPEQVYDVLNEMVIDRGPNAFLTNIECYEKGRFITRVQADGIMLSTPTGSTAYSVAAGGSMVHPNVPAILLTPICPHSLSFRPILLPDYAELEFRIPDNARCTAWACFDGRSRQELGRGDSIRVRMSDTPMPTINKADLTSDWFDSLERCFRWSDRKQQKPFSAKEQTSPPPATLPAPPADVAEAPIATAELQQLQQQQQKEQQRRRSVAGTRMDSVLSPGTAAPVAAAAAVAASSAAGFGAPEASPPRMPHASSSAPSSPVPPPPVARVVGHVSY